LAGDGGKDAWGGIRCLLVFSFIFFFFFLFFFFSFHSSIFQPEEQMLAWQQYQRLKFEFKERSLPLDGSYQPTPPAGGWKKEGGGQKEGLFRSTSTPVLQNDPRLSIQHNPGVKRQGLSRQMSGALGS
jgi:hypothetical protein